MPSQSSQQARLDQTTSVPTPAQSAAYTYDMLVCLEKLAADHKQAKLARLIQVAATEARDQAGAP